MIPKPPKWLPWACAGVMFTGMGLFIGGPILSMAAASASVDARLSPVELRDPALREEAYAAALADRRERDAWVIPVGMGLAAMGTMSLLFVFVTRPMGSDLDDSAADTTASGSSAPDATPEEGQPDDGQPDDGQPDAAHKG